jgi:hypothetical protein
MARLDRVDLPAAAVERSSAAPSVGGTSAAGIMRHATMLRQADRPIPQHMAGRDARTRQANGWRASASTTIVCCCSSVASSMELDTTPTKSESITSDCDVH